MFTQMKDHLAKQLAEIKANGLYKVERTIITPQSSAIRIAERSGKVLNFCANNYLGLSDNPRLISAAKKAMDSHGFGMSSVRFICGAQDLHRELEKAIARYFHTEDTILYAACFDANGGVFEPLFTEEDAIISDALNHASIIDAFAKPNVIATPMPTWKNSNGACRKHKLNDSVSSSPTEYSRWTVMWLRWTRFATWPKNTMLWSWSTNVTRQES